MRTRIKMYTPFLSYFEGEDGGGGGVVSDASDSGDLGESAQVTEQEASINPAWEPMLAGIPSSLHQMVTPHLRKWDQNFQTELQKVQSQYEPFKPLLDSGADAESLQRALAFYQTVEADPRRVYDEMTQYYGFGQDQGQQEQVQGSEEVSLGDEDDDPRYAELRQNQEAIAQLLMSQHEKEQAARFEQQVEADLASVKESHPNMSEKDEIMLYRVAMANGSTLAEAAKELFTYTESIQQSALAGRSPAPSVMSATGTVPGSTPIDPRKLDSKQTKDLVAQMLANKQ